MPRGIYTRIKPAWNKGLTKEIDERVKALSDLNKDNQYGLGNKGHTQPHSKEAKEKIGKANIGNKHRLGCKCKYSIESKIKMRKPKSKEHVKNISDGRKKYLEEHPESLEKIIKNGYGIKCYSNDRVFHYSKQEMSCYDWVRKELKLKIKRFGRFDFIIGNVVLEYHPFQRDGKTAKQYYDDRRRLLNKIDHRDLSLIVMTSLKEEEKIRVNKILMEE